MIHNKFRYLLTLVALFAMTAGAWAQEETLLTTITPTGDGTYSETTAGAVTVTPAGSFFYSNSSYGWRWDSYGSLTVTANEGYTITRCVFIQQGKNQSVTISEAPFALNFEEWLCYENPSMDGVTSIEVYGTAEAPIVVEPVAGKTNEWTFNQPGGDVVLTPLYAPTATWAVVEKVEQLPAAAEGVIAGTDAPLIVEGIVAFAGTSTEVTQGTVMYAVTPATVTDASELIPSDWKNTVPTAKNIADGGAEVKVWYYIQGADTPDGETPTADNTFNNSDIASLTVSVRSNKFDLAFKAANANTIEAGKATVTVGGTAATVTDGKLQGVKMGSEVKMTAKQGYKFRKVEVKKGGAATLATALENGATVVINYVFNNYPPTVFTFTNNNGTYSCNITGQEASNFTGSLTLNGSTLTFSAVTSRKPDNINLTIDFDTASDTYSFTKKGSYYNSYTISVNGTDITSQLTEEK